MDNPGDPTSREEGVRGVASRFAQALRAARAGAWEWKVTTNEAFWSDENYELMGIDPGSGVASYDAWLSALHPDDREAAEQAVRSAVEAGEDLDIEFRVVLPDGRIRWLRDVGQMVFDADGNPVAMYGIQMDVTDRRLAKLARQQAESQLHRAQRMEAIGTLAGGVAHDFNNLLTVILSASDVLRLRLGDGADGGELDEIRDAAQRGATLTRQLLAFSRRQALKACSLDLNALVEQLAPMIRRVVREDVELVLTLAPELPPVLADPAQMDQVLMNLVINARDAMPDGGTLTVETRANADSGSPPQVVLEVHDTGVGMDGETVARVFDPFFTTKGGARGTGLGLSTVYGIVTQSGGSIEVRSTPRRGSTFTIRLPVADEPPATAGPPPEVVLESRPGAVVLLVEDDLAVRDVIERALGTADYRVLCAADADDATRIAREHEAPIDLLLTDVVLPGASGVELAERLKRDRPGLRVLYISGHAHDELVRRGLTASPGSFLHKPFTREGLLAGVEKALA